MLRKSLFIRCLLAILIASFMLLTLGGPAKAASVDPYIRQYLQVRGPVEIEMDGQGALRQFSEKDLSVGKRLFMQHCINCHVGGATLPNPMVSLSLDALKGANPPRDNINAIVAYLREPMNYDGTDLNYWCRDIPESWLPTKTVEKLAAFLLRAAQKSPGWGTERFEE